MEQLQEQQVQPTASVVADSIKDVEKLQEGTQEQGGGTRIQSAVPAKEQEAPEEQPSEDDLNYRQAISEVKDVKAQIDEYVNQFFEEKLDKVRSRESMIVASKYEDKIKQAKQSLKQIEEKVVEQRQKMTTQKELAHINQEIIQFTETAAELRKKLDKAEQELLIQKKVMQTIQDRNKEKRGILNQANRENLQLSYEIEELKQEQDLLRQQLSTKQTKYMGQLKNDRNSQSIQNLQKMLKSEKYKTNHKSRDSLMSEQYFGSSKMSQNVSIRTPAASSKQLSKNGSVKEFIKDRYAKGGLMKDKKILNQVSSKYLPGIQMSHPEVDITKLTKLQQGQMAEYVKQIQKLEKEHDKMRLQKMKLKESQYQHTRKYKENESLFLDCLYECNQYNLRQEELNRNDQQGMFFELYKSGQNQKTLKHNNYNQRTEFEGQTYHKSHNLDGHTNTILFQTIKHIINKAKQEQMIKNIREISIKWDEFKDFSPMQIISLYNVMNCVPGAFNDN